MYGKFLLIFLALLLLFGSVGVEAQSSLKIIGISEFLTVKAGQATFADSLQGAKVDTLFLDQANQDLFLFRETEDHFEFGSANEMPELHIDYNTGALEAGTLHGIIHLNIDNTGSTGGEVYGMTVAKIGDGSAEVEAIGTFTGVIVIDQHIGTFGAPDKALKFYKLGVPSDTTEVTSALASTSIDSTLFNHDDDEFLIGDAAVFDEIKVILNTGAGGAGVAPIFYYSSGGDGSWTLFDPTDGTSGFRQNGIINWDVEDLTWTSWDYDGTDQYWVKIVRTRVVVPTIPIEDTIQILASTEYQWDENADLTIHELYSVTGVKIGTDDTDYLIDEASNGSDSATLYIGDESILVSGDIGISDDYIVEIDGADIASGEYARFTSNGLESRTASEVAADIQDDFVDLEIQTIIADSSFTMSHGTAFDMADGTYTGETFIMKADANMDFGDVCFLNTDSEMVESQGDAAGKPGVFMCVESGGVSANAYGTYLISGMVRNNAWTTVDTAGSIVYVSEITAGLPTETQPTGVGEFWNEIGYVIDTDIISFRVNLKVAGL